MAPLEVGGLGGLAVFSLCWWGAQEQGLPEEGIPPRGPGRPGQKVRAQVRQHWGCPEIHGEPRGLSSCAAHSRAEEPGPSGGAG